MRLSSAWMIMNLSLNWISGTHSSRGSPQSMVSVAYTPVTATTSVCQRLSSSPTSLNVIRLWPPKPEGVNRRWRLFSETRNPRTRESVSSSNTEKMYSFLWRQKEDQIKLYRTSLDQNQIRSALLVHLLFQSQYLYGGNQWKLWREVVAVGEDLGGREAQRCGQDATQAETSGPFGLNHL